MDKCRLCYSYAVNPDTGDRKNIDRHKDLCDVCFWKVQVHKYDCNKCMHKNSNKCNSCINNPKFEMHYNIDNVK